MEMKKEKMIQELYDALNVDIQDLIKSEYKSTTQLRYVRSAILLNKWVKEIKKKNPEFILQNRLENRNKINSKTTEQSS